MVSTYTAARRAYAALLAGALAALLVGLTPSPALAHESREVGPHTWVVGFVNEPAYSGLPNGVDLRISVTATEEPFVDLGESLSVDVTFGEETMTLGFRSQFGVDGGYRADFVPSRPGQYTFRFYGTVGDVEVDETFTSGPETFSDIRDISQESWPVQDPTTGQMAERLDRELARIDESLAAMEDGSMDEETEEEGDNGDTMARVLGGAGIVLGVAGLGAAMFRRKT